MNLSERDAHLLSVIGAAALVAVVILYLTDVYAFPTLIVAVCAFGLILMPIELVAMMLSPRYKAWRQGWKRTAQARRTAGQPALNEKQRSAIAFIVAGVSVGLATL